MGSMGETEVRSALTIERIASSIEEFAEPAGKNWWLAYSGGIDSTVLLYLLSQIVGRYPGVQLGAIHVNHKLHPDSDRWAEHCRQCCARLAVTFKLETIPTPVSGGAGLEAAARNARYQAIGRTLGKGDVLFTGHHRGDQVETLLYRLVRGAGVRGLSAMRSSRDWGQGALVRPLLKYSRASIEQFAKKQALHWLEDPSNQVEHFDRNFIRHRLLPLIEQHWVDAEKVIARASINCADSDLLEEELAKIDYEFCKGVEGNRIKIEPLGTLSHVRQINVLRRWIRWNGFQVPGREQLLSIYSSMVTSQSDTNPLFAQGGLVLRRYRGEIYALLSSPPVRQTETAWVAEQNLYFPELKKLLSIERRSGLGIRADLAKSEQGLVVRFRRGGEVMRFRGHRRKLKTLLQEWEIPPWQREQIPLIYSGNELIAVPGYAISDEAQVGVGKEGILPVWSSQERRP